MARKPGGQPGNHNARGHHGGGGGGSSKRTAAEKYATGGFSAHPTGGGAAFSGRQQLRSVAIQQHRKDGTPLPEHLLPGGSKRAYEAALKAISNPRARYLKARKKNAPPGQPL